VSLVIDASVAVQWVLDEVGTPRAIALRDKDRLIAPTLIAAEVGSAIWKAVRRGAVSRGDALIAVESVLLPFDELMPIEEMRLRALDIAMALDHPIYDCFYLALAERERCPLVSADAKLVAAAKRMNGIDVWPL